MKGRTIFVTLADLLIVMISFILSLALRIDFEMQSFLNISGFFMQLPLVLLVYLILIEFFHTNRTIWSNVSIDEAFNIIAVNSVATGLLFVIKTMDLLKDIPGSVILISFFVSTLLMEGMRFSYRLVRLFTRRYTKAKNGRLLVIYGAGSSGQLLAKEIEQNKRYNYHLLGFIDDDPYYNKKHLLGYPILGNGQQLKEIVEEYGVEEVIIAMPSAKNENKKRIATLALDSKVPSVKIMSTSAMILRPEDLNKSLRKIEIKDLLNRKEITFNNLDIQEKIANKRILITGAGGSIGSELVRQVVNYQPKKLVLLDINETGLYGIEQEMMIKIRNGEVAKDIEIETLIGSIRDKRRLDAIFKQNQFDMVFHAAAHKHVPLMEHSPIEAVKNNIFGTRNLIEIAEKYEVSDFINISTDKAVNPTNVMGATKRFIEMMLQCESHLNSKTKFVAVRFGNVLGSNGSVIPLFQSQIEKGGPVTVTHPEIVRYFMTIPEAVSLVLQASTYAKGGEIFVLDMGDPVKIKDLAEQMIRLSGYAVGEDIEIQYVGLRPGEKLYEELLMAEEGLNKTDNDLIYVARPVAWDKEYIDESLQKLQEAVKTADKDQVINTLKEVVKTYKDATI